MSDTKGFDENELNGVDPAFAAMMEANPVTEPDDSGMAELRARVLDAAPTNVVPLRPRRRGAVIGLAVAASCALLAGTGALGVMYGKSTAPVTVASGTQTNALPIVGANTVARPQVNGQPQANGQPQPALGAPEGMGTRNSSGGGVTSGTMGKVSDAMAMPYGYGRTILVPAQGLSDTSGSAPGYRFDASKVDRAALAATLADRFGVAGTVEKVSWDGGVDEWHVGPNDGSAPTVVVSGDQLASWWYSNPNVNPWMCEKVLEGGGIPSPMDNTVTDSVAPVPVATASAVDPVAPDTPGAVAGSTGGSAEPVPSTCPSVTPPPSDSQAKDIVSGLLTSIGVDTSTLDWDINHDDYTSSVIAWQLLNGSRTTQSWSVTLAGKGEVMWAGGFAAGLETLPDYPIVGAKTAALRSNETKWSTLGPVQIGGDQVIPLGAATAMDSLAGSGAAAGGGAAESGTGAAKSSANSGTAPSLEVTINSVEVTDAKLGVTQVWQPDGSLLLVPAWVYTGSDGSTWSMVAVADDYVSFGTGTVNGTPSR